MSTPISIRLDEDMREILEGEAQRRSIGLSRLIREIATDAAKEVRRRRIREQTKAVAEYVAGSPEAKEFFEFWGTPRAEI